ncbi:Alpha/beta hydrolase family protein [Actinomadura rubteroloni]|uniref:Alpha/beta hydrolase family protein n=1 Tax=Actinomadura rubteroloni TaxID=1926885 RepID=A0A2P4UJE0_9ACTN|nr:alpha/beta hydrolase [Actinomadura rubteroloni]POM25164.1 Alpha/beta hydrolase family protein [Actinomadura rubteroloni]
MHFTAEQRHDGVREREFTLGEIPGILWTPDAPSEPVPLILMGHSSDLTRMRPRLTARAEATVAQGFAAATIELPGNGTRPRIPAFDQARADLRTALKSGAKVTEDIIDRLILPLIDQAAPESREALDALQSLPEIAPQAGYAGGITALAIRLATIDPRIKAAVLFAGSYLPSTTFEEARALTIPVHVLLQWDDEGNDRQAALDLFDALNTKDKTLHANMGGHTGVPAFEAPASNAFFTRHLK